MAGKMIVYMLINARWRVVFEEVQRQTKKERTRFLS